jgi:hypothetical protein
MATPASDSWAASSLTHLHPSKPRVAGSTPAGRANSLRELSAPRSAQARRGSQARRERARPLPGAPFWPDLARARFHPAESGDISLLAATGRNLPTEILFAVSGQFLRAANRAFSSLFIRFNRRRTHGIVVSDDQVGVGADGNSNAAWLSPVFDLIRKLSGHCPRPPVNRSPHGDYTGPFGRPLKRSFPADLFRMESRSTHRVLQLPFAPSDWKWQCRRRGRERSPDGGGRVWRVGRAF